MKKITAHLHSFKHAWLTIIQQPIEHLINIIVLALIISICLTGVMLNNNLESWQKKNITYPQMVVYLAKTATQNDVGNIEKILNKLTKTSIHNYQFISKEQGLADLQHDEQLKSVASDVISASDNPLPNILIINTATANGDELQRLNLQLSQLPLVDEVHTDFAYAGKISDLIAFVNTVCLFIEVLFIIVLSLVVYNMIRLQMLLKSDEILVSRLIGASDSFIMRPLMHYALGQIALATILAGLSMHLATGFLNKLLGNFSNLFAKGIILVELPISEYLVIWLTLAAFTSLTVFLAVRWVFYNTQTNQKS